MEVNYVKLAAANQQLELYANTGKPLNKAAALYIVFCHKLKLLLA